MFILADLNDDRSCLRLTDLQSVTYSSVESTFLIITYNSEIGVCWLPNRIDFGTYF